MARWSIRPLTAPSGIFASRMRGGSAAEALLASGATIAKSALPNAISLRLWTGSGNSALPRWAQSGFGGEEEAMTGRVHDGALLAQRELRRAWTKDRLG